MIKNQIYYNEIQSLKNQITDLDEKLKQQKLLTDNYENDLEDEMLTEN